MTIAANYVKRMLPVEDVLQGMENFYVTKVNEVIADVGAALNIKLDSSNGFLNPEQKHAFDLVWTVFFEMAEAKANMEAVSAAEKRRDLDRIKGQDYDYRVNRENTLQQDAYNVTRSVLGYFVDNREDMVAYLNRNKDIVGEYFRECTVAVPADVDENKHYLSLCKHMVDAVLVCVGTVKDELRLWENSEACRQGVASFLEHIQPGSFRGEGRRPESSFRQMLASLEPLPL